MNEVLFLIKGKFHIINEPEKGPKLRLKVVRRYRDDAAALHALDDGFEGLDNPS